MERLGLVQLQITAVLGLKTISIVLIRLIVVVFCYARTG